MGMNSSDDRKTFAKEVKVLKPYAERLKKEHERQRKEEKKKLEQEKKLAKKKKKWLLINHCIQIDIILSV